MEILNFEIRTYASAEEFGPCEEVFPKSSQLRDERAMLRGMARPNDPRFFQLTAMVYGTRFDGKKLRYFTRSITGQIARKL